MQHGANLGAALSIPAGAADTIAIVHFALDGVASAAAVPFGADSLSISE